METKSDEVYPRRFISLPDKKGTKDFTVLQFNVLADGLSGSDPKLGGFINITKDVLDFSTRKQRLLDEILRADPDIVCVQELDHFSDWLEPALESVGFSGIYQKKPFSPGLAICGLEDGCAIFWKNKLFSRKENYTMNYLDTKKGKSSNQIAIVVTLTLLNNPEKTLIVANTHLKSQKDAEGEEQREDQIKQLLTKLQSTTTRETPVIICMDMNGTPGGSKYASTAYPYIRSHAMKFGSAYGGKGAADEPPLTTWKLREGGEAKHTIDYIFYTENTLEPLKIWSIPNSEVGPERLPSARYPSDHFALAAQMRFR